LIKIDEVKKRKRCFDPIHAASVVYSGDVVLCCEDYFGNYKYGNVNSEKLIDIWNKEEFRRVRKECSKGIYNLDICKKCVGII
jgi:radical SAM protein with 4Fe4S-binding SPASM domain